MKLIVYLFFSLQAISSLALSNDIISSSNRFSIHAQSTIINQTKLGFLAPYTGKSSLSTQQESKMSLTNTLYLGVGLWKGASFYLNPEIAGGAGISDVLGIGGATNGETFRIGSHEPQFYIARLFFKQVFDLNNGVQKNEKNNYFHHRSDFNKLEETTPIRYFSFVIGKVSLADYFDDNKYSHDPRTQFMNWGLMSNGAWDYAANTRGYIPAVVLQFVTPSYELRYATALLPLEANGNDLNWNYAKSNSHNLELTKKYKINNRAGAFRVLSFLNTTYMGNYSESVQLQNSQPQLTNVRKYGGLKFGFGLNFEQDLTDELGFFSRFSWNDGRYETWAFTEIDHSFSAGFSVNGKKWHSPNDQIGIAYLVNGLSKDHQTYLAAGGSGFMLGDGKLNYGLENIFETYYLTQLVQEHIFLTGNYQLVLNPGYNIDRSGPVHVFSIRMHYRI